MEAVPNESDSSRTPLLLVSNWEVLQALVRWCAEKLLHRDCQFVSLSEEGDLACVQSGNLIAFSKKSNLYAGEWMRNHFCFLVLAD